MLIVAGGGETTLETSMRCSVVFDHLSSCPECYDDFIEKLKNIVVMKDHIFVLRQLLHQ